MRSKRLIATISVITMLFGSVGVYGAGTPITRGEAARMLALAADDYTYGISPEDILKDSEEDTALTRAQALVMLKRAFGEFPAPKGNDLRSGYPAENFTDVPDSTKEEIADVLASGIVAGTSENTLSPDAPITAEQLELLIKRTYAYMGKNLKDDYWASVNKPLLDTLEIPEGNTYVGGAFATITDTVDKQIKDIIDELLAGNYEKGSKEQKIADFYRSTLNKEYRKKTGMAPIMPYIESIDKAENIDDIVKVNNTLINELALVPFMCFNVITDIKDNSKNMMTFQVISGSLGAKELYEYEDIINEYKKVIETYFKAIGEPEDKASNDAELVIGYEKRVMKYFPDYNDRMNAEGAYNLFKLDDIKKMFPEVDMDSVYDALGYDESWKNTDMLIGFPNYTKAIAAEFTQDNIDTLKAYAKFMLVYYKGGMLSDELRDAYYDFVEATGMGVRSTPEQDALDAVKETFPEYLGKIYIDKYFPAENKQNVENMVKDIINVYKANLKNIEWMSDETKEKALLKLDEMKILIGYPDEFKDPYEYAEINSDSYFENDISLSLSAQKKNIENQFEPVDKNDMNTAVYTVNAFYNQTINGIIFPAAILQAPFYDYDASYETNLGGIGYIIAHEISHAFDNHGSAFDENGNVANWWTDEDKAAFDALCDKMVEYYDGQEVAPGIISDGEMTLGENIADNGAMNCILEIASHLDDPDYDALFRSAALCWAESYDRDSLKYNTIDDPHSNSKLRINRVLENNQIFYDTYGIKEGDGMYVAPENRVKIW